ncbi:MAG: pentapeptide repeat-containing protein [Candidatus Omnitrophota bacterium]
MDKIEAGEELVKLEKDDLLARIRKREPVELSGENLSGADLTRTDLSGLTLFDTDLSKSDLVGADLSDSDLTGADLSYADLTKAKLKGTRLWNANLRGAKLVEADLSGADLWKANLFNTRLWRACLTDVKGLTKNNFRCADGKFMSPCKAHEAGYISAEETYRNLKRYFIVEGRYNDASWASFKEKTMEKMRLFKQRDPAYIPIALMGLLCGYGEMPIKIVVSSLCIILSYAFVFYLLKMAVVASGSMPLGFGDYLYYSIVTFTTLGYGDIVPKAVLSFRLLAASEAFFGAFLMGLFIFTLARKYSAR